MNKSCYISGSHILKTTALTKIKTQPARMNTHILKALLILGTGTLASTSLFAQTLTVAGQSGYPNSGDVDSSAGSSDLSAFTTSITSAFAANTGATNSFDGNANSTGFDTMVTTFGTSDSRSVSFTSSQLLQTVGIGGSFTPLGTEGITTKVDAASYTLTFGDILESGNPIAGAGIIHLGFTVLSRTSTSYPLDVEALVTFDDNSTATLTSNISNLKGADDTFFEFLASGDRTISSLTISAFATGTSTPVSRRIALDNLGFVTSIPEPQTYGLIGGILVLTVTLVRRKRG
jgi:hypothetical protein